MVEGLHEKIRRERDATQPKAKDLAIYRRYAQGEQDSTLTPDMMRLLRGASKHPYSDNLADMVLSAWSSRMILHGFSVEDGAVQAFLDGVYTRNHLGDLSFDTNYATGRDGNHVLMLRWLPEEQATEALDVDAEAGDVPPSRASGQVTVHAENWWDGERGVWVAYDDRGRPAYAVKDFTALIAQADGRMVPRNRRTVYFPDHIERFIQQGNGWEPYPLPGEPDNGRVPWLKRDGSPLGIPIVHFSFPRFGQRRYGVSELAGGFLANQDHINDVQLDITATARLLGFQILWSTGVEWDTPPTLQPGTFLKADPADAAFGSIPAGDLRQLISAHEVKLQTIARITATPIHIIRGGDWPSGKALIEAERSLLIKVSRLVETLFPAWVEVAHRATEMANAFGNAGLSEDALLTADFIDPEQPGQLAQAEMRKAQAEAELAVEMLQDPESLMAMGMTEQEANQRIQRREAAAERRDVALTGIGAESPDTTAVAGVSG